MKRNMTPHEPGTFGRGVPVSPPDRLLAWLAAQQRDGEARLIRLPILLGSGMHGFSTANCTIGAGSEVLTVGLDDAALGVGIIDRARACRGQSQCAMWLEGYWQGKDASGAYQFRVTHVHEVLEPTAILSANYTEVEVPCSGS